MDKLAKQLFKYSRPIIRPFKLMTLEGPGDVPYLWDIYQKGILTEIPTGMSMEEFAEVSTDIVDNVDVSTLEDRVDGEFKAIGFMVCRFNGWQIEPHVIFFDNATTRIKLRIWVAIIRKTKYSTKAGSCLIRVENDARKMANRIEKMGLLQYVGRVWGGCPSGNEYLYAMRCARRHQ